MHKPRIAIQNLHKLPNLATWKIHNYVVELVKRGHVQYLYFDELHPFSNMRNKISALNQIRRKYNWDDLGLSKVKCIFTQKGLNDNVDILLNFNMALESEFTPALRTFKGIKIFHLMDYFWSEPGSIKNDRLVEFGVDYVMNYGNPGKHCPYFQSVFPSYVNRVIPVPFGYSDRFVQKTQLKERTKKCVALGSVNPLRPDDAEPKNYIESGNFFKHEQWFHKFRRLLVEHRDELATSMDSMLPIFPLYKDASYDIVQKLNDYQMFTCCESIFHFPAAKTFEGPACGTVLVCSDHPCYTEYGFKDGENCITHKALDVQNFKEKILYYQKNEDLLEKISDAGHAFVTTYYSHAAIADNLARAYSAVFALNHGHETPVHLTNHSFWPLYTDGYEKNTT